VGLLYVLHCGAAAGGSESGQTDYRRYGGFLDRDKSGYDALPMSPQIGIQP
jgi:hypothetical protein